MSPLALTVIGLLMGVFIGLNGPLIGTFTTFITTKLGKKNSSNKIAGLGLLTLFYLIMIVVIASFAISSVVENISKEYQQALIIVVPIITICIGISLIRRYFWHEPIVKLKHTKEIALYQSVKTNSFLQPLYMAATLVYIVLPVLLVTIFSFSLITLLLDELSLFWVLPFSIGLIVPMYGVLALLATKTNASKIMLWKDKTKATMYLYCGFSLLVIAWVVLYVTIQQGGL